jgi:hypothetical protein
MQSTFDPTTILHTSIAIFMASPELTDLETFLADPSWPHHSDAASRLSLACLKAKALDLFATKLVQITAALAEKRLSPELVLSPSDDEASAFRRHLASTIKGCVCPAYKAKRITEQDIGPAYFAVLIRSSSDRSVIASTLSNFRNYPDNMFVTRMEAVHPTWQRKGVGTSLFRFTEVAVEFLVNADPFVRLNLGGATSTEIEAYVDHDAPEWHREMMEKMEFEHSGRRGDDIVFSKTIDSM